LDRARDEATALRELHVDEQVGSEVLDQLHLGRFRSVKTFDQLTAMVREPWNLDSGREAGLEVLRRVAQEKKTELFAAERLAELGSMAEAVGDLDTTLRDDLLGHAAAVAVVRCGQARDCNCVTKNVATMQRFGVPEAVASSAKGRATAAFAAALKADVAAATASMKAPYARQASLRNAISAGKCYELLAGSAAAPPVSALEADLKVVDRDVEVADRKAAELAAAERKKRDAQEAAAERVRMREEAAAEARQGRLRVQCCDGTLSPSCLCAGARKGCCSHHQGVCGCEE
jgi:hypothetical protein